MTSPIQRTDLPKFIGVPSHELFALLIQLGNDDNQAGALIRGLMWGSPQPEQSVFAESWDWKA